MTLGIIGGGVMGEAIVFSLITKKIFRPKNILVSDCNPQKLSALQKKYQVRTAVNLKVADQADIIILAIKPQQAEEVFGELKGEIKKTSLIISIMAGKSIGVIKSGLATGKIIRAMPNTPAQIGEGMTVWQASSKVTAKEKKIAQKIFRAFGEEVEVKKEDLLNVATAISGSGPAYIFSLASILLLTAIDMGFNKNSAGKITKQLFYGAAKLMRESDLDPKELREKVTSKGGTTEAALKVLFQKKCPQMVAQAIKAAYTRARELQNK